jgi:hypothetical protein
MKAWLTITILATLVCVGCKSTMYHPVTDKFPVTRQFNATYDRVWQATVSAVSKKGELAESNKRSGVIKTKNFSLGASLFAERELSRYAMPPFALIVVWSQPQANLDVNVKRGSTGVSVGITGHFRAFELYGSRKWEDWYSQGIMETQLLDEIERSLRR